MSRLLLILCTLISWWELAIGHGAMDDLLQAYRSSKVAISVQGRVTDLHLWMLLYKQMYSKADVELFLLSYDQPYKCPAHIYCYYFPNSTWTTGRNALARKIYEREQDTGRAYKYWGFHDADTWDLSCVACR
jgi:hypothetical protein